MLYYTDKADTKELQESLFGCFSDCGSCMTSFCCPPVANAKAWAAARDETCSCCHMCVPLSPIWTRANIRRARGMTPGLCGSAMTYGCCPCCFTAQNIREIKAITAQCTDNDEATP